ncbi:MAG: pyridoxal-phosphate dependent enzyme [Betaproteobacteria bacterium]
MSTRGLAPPATLAAALADGLAPDGGLYVPESIEPWSRSDLERLPSMSIAEIGARVLQPFARDELSGSQVSALVRDALDFPVPLVEIQPGVRALELFHGPTLAFKDIGARVMARLIAALDRGGEPATILVATSGDTGSAVAHAFHGTGARVVVLYPEGRVSPTQEAQLTMFNTPDGRGNVRAFAIAGTFDDCQRLVKTAFADRALRERVRLTSANSINLGRLLPQMIYYFTAGAGLQAGPVTETPVGAGLQASPVTETPVGAGLQASPVTETPVGAGLQASPVSETPVGAGLQASPVSETPVGAGLQAGPNVVVSVPSGNFGNLTAGLFAKRAGAPIERFVAATNVNDVVPAYLLSGVYTPRPSLTTLTNAMDVGNPSNFERMRWLFRNDVAAMRSEVNGSVHTDAEVRATIAQVYRERGYLLDPHSAIAYLGIVGRAGLGGRALGPRGEGEGIFLATAHPAKFREIVEPIIGRPVDLPEALAAALARPLHRLPLAATPEALGAALDASRHA